MPKKWSVILGGITLFALNVSICWRLFFAEYTQHFASIEPIFFALAKGIRAHWPDPGWWSVWNTGLPFNYTYQPLLPHLVAAVSLISGWSEARAFHFAVAGLYCLGPVTLYALVMRLTRRWRPSLVCGILYTFISPSALAVHKIAADMGGWWYPKRLRDVTAYGDAPNIAGLTFLPLAIFFLDRALERRTAASWFLAAVAVAVVALTNIPATIAMSMAIVAYALALDPKTWLRRWLAIAGAGVAGYLLFAFWLPPSGLFLMATNVPAFDPGAQFTMHKVPYLAGLVAAVACLTFGLHRYKAPVAVRFVSLFALITSAVALCSSWYGVDVVGQGYRFHHVMDMAVVSLIALGFAYGAGWTRGRARAIGLVLVFLCSVQWREHRQFMKHQVRRPDVTSRSEYKVAMWMRDHAHGDRVFVPGSTSFWLDYWTDTPQIEGCCTQNQLVDAIWSAEWVIDTDQATGDRAADISATWLEVLGVHYVAVDGPASTEEYKDMRHPWKFEGVFRRRWREGDDAIYEVPLASASLAHVVRPDELVARKPVNGVDVEPLAKYRAAILDPQRPQADFRWIGSQEAMIRGKLPPGFVFSVQVPYHAGWHAVCAGGGGNARISKDALGFMTIAADCGNPCDVRLIFDGGTERIATGVVSLLAWIGFGGFFILRPLADARGPASVAEPRRLGSGVQNA